MYAVASNHTNDSSSVSIAAPRGTSNDRSIFASLSKKDNADLCLTKSFITLDGMVDRNDFMDENSKKDMKHKKKKLKNIKIHSGGRIMKDLEASEIMAAWCFDLLINELKGNTSPPAAPTILRKFAEDGAKCSVFVTWMKKRSGHEHVSFDKARTELRGCIGCLEPIPILSLGEYAIKSGLKDRRFQPISSNELRHLICQISLLGCFEKCDHVYQWEIGTHGIIVNFSDPKGKRYSATFLPEIAEENKMSHKMTIHELIRKSHFIGPITDALIERIEVTRYRSSKVELTYDKYMSHFAFN